MAGVGIVEIVGANVKRILLSDGWHTVANVQLGKGVFRSGDASVALSMSGEHFLSFTENDVATIVPMSMVVAYQQ